MDKGLDLPLESMIYALTFDRQGNLLAGLRDGRLLQGDAADQRWQNLQVNGQKIETVLAMVAI